MNCLLSRRLTAITVITLGGVIGLFRLPGTAGNGFAGTVRAQEHENDRGSREKKKDEGETGSDKETFEELRSANEELKAKVAAAEKAVKAAEGKLEARAQAQNSVRNSKDEAKKKAAEKAYEEAAAEKQEKDVAYQDLLQQQARGILRMARHKGDETIEYLSRQYGTERNVGILMTVTQALGSIGDEKAVKAIVLKGSKALVKNSFAAQSIADALSKPLEPDAEIWFLRKGRTTPTLRNDPELWRQIVPVMAKFRSEERIEALTSELRSTKSPELQIVILETLEEHKDPKVAAAASRLLRAKSPEVRVAALLCLYNQDAKKYRSKFIGGLKSPHWQVRLLCLRILRDLEERKIVGYATKLLEDPEPRVQLSAVRVLLRIGGKEVIPALIAAMSKVQGRVLDDLADALARLSGKDFGPAAVQWESWWEQVKDSPQQFMMLSPEAYSALLAERENQQTLLLSYYGLRILSKNVIFIVDTSQSMTKAYVPKQERAKEEKERGKVETGPRGSAERPQRGGAGTGTRRGSRAGRGRTRMEVAKAEMLKVVKSFKDGRKFDIIGFDSVVKDFIQDELGQAPQGLVTMEREVRERARTFIEKVRPNGLTHMLSALRTALAYPDVDTIYLLSDGSPTPESGNTEEILRYLRRENRLRSVRINTIGFHLDGKAKEFLLQLAEQNYGVFVER